MSTRWYFDFISPFAWLQWPRIRELAAHEPIEFRPLLFAGLLAHHGQKGPADIPAKRRNERRCMAHARRTRSDAVPPTPGMGSRIIAKQRRACAAASPGAEEPSASTGAVPETKMRSPTRCAREKP